MVEVTSLPVDGYVNAVAWNGDGSRLAALSGFGTQITIWEPGSWRVVNDFTRYGGAYSGNSMSYLADGSLLVPSPVGRSPDPPYRTLFSTSFEQIDPVTGKRLRYVEDRFYDRGRRRIMDTFSVSQGNMIAGIPAGNPAMVSLFESKPWSLNRNFDVADETSRRGYARSIALSSDRLAVGTADGHLKVYDTKSGRLVLDKDFPDAAYAISATAFSLDGRFIAFGRARSYGSSLRDIRMLRVLATDTYEDVGPISHGAIDTVFSLCWGPHGEIAAAAGTVLESLRVNSDSAITALERLAGRDFYSAAYARDGTLAVSQGSSVAIHAAAVGG